jgi:hypothetical protein
MAWQSHPDTNIGLNEKTPGKSHWDNDVYAKARALGVPKCLFQVKTCHFVSVDERGALILVDSLKP